MTTQQTLLQEIFIPATTDVQVNGLVMSRVTANCQSGCSGKCVGITSIDTSRIDDLPNSFYA